jgi:hypothetical protein
MSTEYRNVPVLQKVSYVKCDKCGCEITHHKLESRGIGPFAGIRETVTINMLYHKSKSKIVLRDYSCDIRDGIDLNTFEYSTQRSDFDELERFDLCDTCYEKFKTWLTTEEK